MTALRGILAIVMLAVVTTGGWMAPAHAVTRQDTMVNGIAVYRFIWEDSKGLRRSISLKKEGSGNSGHGGYAVQATYRYIDNGVTKTALINAPTGDGFGYFVSHERYRKFSDGDSSPIAQKIFGRGDSPLGRGFAVATRTVASAPNKGIIQFRLTYPRYGTIDATTFNPNTGEDDPPLSTNPALYTLYDLPVQITWYFQDGKDHPRIVTRVNMMNVPGPDRVSFDVRGPYGKLDFDLGSNPIRQVLWGDRFHFKTTSTPLKRSSTWVWTQTNSGARYNSLIADRFEMGLIEPRPFSKSGLNDGYSDGRGKNSATYFNGNGCPDPVQRIPCDYEWPYQSSQYELPYDNQNGTTTSEKIAWGSAPYYGMSVTSTYDGTTSVPFVGFPTSKIIQYHVCLVLGRLVPGGLTRMTAVQGQGYNCAETSPD
jgi:hypothetical protein